MNENRIAIDLTMICGYGSPADFISQRILFSDHSETENRVINLYPEISCETFEGFGGAVTDSSGYVYSMMAEEQKKELVNAYFSPERMHYTCVRVPLDSCDFSLKQHEAVSDPDDRELNTFSMEGMEQYILPLLSDANKEAGGKLRLMLTPWSPPSFMKTNGKREQGGKLKPEFRQMWADYLCRYIQEFRKRGFIVERISLQNEAKAVQIWDSCVFTAEEEKTFLRDYMWPAMERSGLTDVEVFLWDHNKERVYEWMRDIIDETTAPMISGAACHWYSGDHFEALELCRKVFPDKKLIVSESCVELLKYGTEDEINAAQRLVKEVIGDLNHGAVAFYDWNLLLDENGGPNYVKNYCQAPFFYDTGSMELKPRLTALYYGVISHYLEPGSVRIASTCFSENVKVTAWRRPEGEIVIFMLNVTDQLQKVVLRLLNTEAQVILPERAFSVGVITKDAPLV